MEQFTVIIMTLRKIRFYSFNKNFLAMCFRQTTIMIFVIRDLGHGDVGQKIHRKIAQKLGKKVAGTFEQQQSC